MKRLKPDQQKERKPFRKTDTGGFTAKQQAFIMAMSASPDSDDWGNASAAARTAGYKCKNVGIYACQLMKKPKIKAAIEANRGKIMQKFEIDGERVIQELAALAFVNLCDFYDDSGILKNIINLPRNVSAALSGLDVQSSVDNSGLPAVTKKIRLHDKIRALELLGKRLKLWTEKFEYVVGAERESMDERAKRKHQMRLEMLGPVDTDEEN